MLEKIKANYKEVYLFPPSIDDWIIEDDPARFICDFVDSLDLMEVGIDVRKNKTGRPCYDERLLLKVWLYGYFECIRSTRKLEKACRRDVGLIWLTCQHYPDHNTLWLFLKNNRKSIKKIFKQAVKVSMKSGLVGMVLNALDGTKIAADVSKKKSFHKKDIELIIEVLEDSVKNYMEEVEENEEEERWEWRLPRKLKKKEERKAWIEKKISELSKEEKLKIKRGVEQQLKELKESDTNHLNETDSECRMIKCEGKIEFAYNAQAVVDDKNGIIVAADVIEDEADNHELVPMLDEVKENTNKIAEETVADGGYFSGSQLYKSESKGYDVLVNILEKSITGNHDKSSEFHQSNFTYDEEKDCYICPREGILTYHDTRKRKDYEARRYQCKDYKTCPVRWECSKCKTGRRIEISPYQSSIENQIEKQKDPDKKALLKRRKEIVEPTFGYMKHILGFRRWTVRGLDKVKPQWYMLCTTVNLKKMYKAWISGKLQLRLT